MITRIIFCFSKNYFIIAIFAIILVFIWVWTRATFPRYRYDLLINLAWKRILPFILSLLFLLVGVINL
jgi:NADH-quinone oxidoreductase subunit H